MLGARILAIAAELDGKFNVSASSDMECAKMLAYSAVMGCTLNIGANLPMIKDSQQKSRLEQASLELKRLAKP